MNKPYLMLVDDEQEFVDTLTERLRTRDCRVLSALSGDEALVKLDKHRDVDVVILDVNMPGLPGLDTLKKIKELYPLIRVVMLTGHATVKSAVEGMKIGAYDYLMKPCEIDELLSKVREATEKKRAHEAKIRDAEVKHALSSYVE